ncbi:MAG TPA: hypothetical protein PLH27_10400 [bacterium]|nr:hypothetical protein [bacterium]HMZ03416.1 hypothetical protein [bacterium]HNB08701.1 hypothetical protein [bacterium]HNC49389.1 hypothetical protein [bacterium]HND77149.1 hypothetical protein [bacterium]
MVKFVGSLIFLFSVVGCASRHVLIEPESPIVFSKRARGGAASWTGEELNAPSLTIYANGVVIRPAYNEGKRRWMLGHMKPQVFRERIKHIQNIRDSVKAMHRKTADTSAAIPVIEWITGSDTLAVRGLGFSVQGGWLDSMHYYNQEMDTWEYEALRPYVASRIRLYVKKSGSARGAQWPVWPVRAVLPSSVYTRDVSYYEPNVTENSVVIEGVIAREVQSAIGQTGVYEKFIADGMVYGIGYVIEVP